MLSNFGNLLLFLNIFLSLTIIYSALRCLKISGKLIPKIIYQISTLQSTLIIICFFTLVAFTYPSGITANLQAPSSSIV